nr:NAD(+)/NADH kinase [Helcococcus sueciensis]
MTKKANIFANLYQLSFEVKEKVIKELIDNDIDVSETFHPDADFNIVIGGDGTFIKAVHDSEFSSIPFIGINTGHLGFYNDVKYYEVEEAIKKLKENDFILNHLKVIDCEIITDDKTYTYNSINEIVLKAKYTSIMNFDLYVDHVKLQTFAGDGILFSTPSGSTAYNLSAGGALLCQNLNAFQITPLAAIRSSLHRSLDKSLVVPKETLIRLVPKSRGDVPFSIGVDGIHKEHDNIREINIKLSDKIINKIVFNPDWFWINIKEKFI